MRTINPADHQATAQFTLPQKITQTIIHSGLPVTLLQEIVWPINTVTISGIDVQNSVFKHCTRKTLPNNKVKNTLDHISTSQELVQETQQHRENVRRIFTQPLGPLRQSESETSTGSTTSKTMTEQDLMVLYQGIRQIWNHMKPEPQKTSKLFANYAAKLCNLDHPLCLRILQSF